MIADADDPLRRDLIARENWREGVPVPLDPIHIERPVVIPPQPEVHGEAGANRPRVLAEEAHLSVRFLHEHVAQLTGRAVDSPFLLVRIVIGEVDDVPEVIVRRVAEQMRSGSVL